jgi:hypothetical protein
MDEACAATDCMAPFRLRLCLERLEADAIREDAKSRPNHHKTVYCSMCDRVMCMRTGAGGCYRGHIGIVTISRATAEMLRAKRPIVDTF